MSAYRNIYQRIQEGEFNNTWIPYPHDKSTREMNADELREHNEVREQNRANDWEMDKKFHEALAEAYFLTDHPKEGKLFSIAWEHGHSSGYSEVLLHYDSLSELLI